MRFGREPLRREVRLNRLADFDILRRSQPRLHLRDQVNGRFGITGFRERGAVADPLEFIRSGIACIEVLG